MGIQLSCVGDRMDTYEMSVKHTYSSSSHFQHTYEIDDCSPVGSRANYYPYKPYTFCSCTRKTVTNKGATQAGHLVYKETRTFGGHPNEQKRIIEEEETGNRKTKENEGKVV